MAKTFLGLLAGWGALPVAPPEAGQGVNSFVHVHRQVINMAAQPDTDTPLLARIPAGHVVLGGELITTATLGATTIAIGTVAVPAKYKAAAVLTATDTPTPFGKAAALAEGPLAVDTDIVLTQVGALPGAGQLVSLIYTSKP